MFPTPFLNRLGLDQAADERAIKRAYARELKLIDQETNAAGFQELRHAYETALQWLKHKPATTSFVPVNLVKVAPVAAPERPPEPEARPAPAPVYTPPAIPPRTAHIGARPQEMAQEVFKDFLVGCNEIVEKDSERDSNLWRMLLERCMDDERLLNITARANFEYLIACLLADGWRPGHEGLFVGARQFFGWNKERRRLTDLGPPGEFLSQAIMESEMFPQQGSFDVSGQTAAVLRVRDPAEAKKRELIAYAPHLKTMAARFPAWTMVIASRERIEQWVHMEGELSRLWRLTSVLRSSGKGADFSLFAFAAVVAISFYVMGVIFQSDGQPASYQNAYSEPREAELTEQEARDEAAYKRAAGKFYMPPGTRKLDPKLMAEQQFTTSDLTSAGQERRFLNDSEKDRIMSRILRLQPAPESGVYKTVFIVELDEGGGIARLTTKDSSGEPMLDRKAEDALRATAPFGDDIRRRFEITLGQYYP